MTEEERRDRIAAFERELAGYRQRGLAERAKEVEQAIAALTGEPAPAAAQKRVERRPAPKGETRD